MTPSKPLRLGLFSRLMLAFLTIIAIGGVVATLLARRATAAEFTVYTTDAARQQAENLAPLLASYYATENSWSGVADIFTTPRIMGSMRRSPMPMMGGDMWAMMGLQVLVVDAEGQVLVDTADILVNQTITADIITENGAPIVVDGSQVGSVLIANGIQSSEQNEQFLGKISRAILSSVGVASLLALLLGGLIVWRVVWPLRQLTTAAEEIADGRLEQQISIPTGDEIGDLGAAFNRMAAQLSRAEQTRRQMTADIAHELRTPLTVIQGNIEALQDGVFPLTPDALNPIMDKTMLLKRLVEDLRLLTLAETDQLVLDRKPVRLQDVVAGTAASFQAEADQRGIELTLDAPPDQPSVFADAQRLQQVVSNLLANALRYTPENGRITLTSSTSPGTIIFSISDTGPGILPEAQPYLFDRFYRADTGRARDAQGGGSGLELAVAKSIVQVHGGSIGVESTPGKGSTFWVRLPTLS